jgi:hypothetical protein
MLMEIMLEGIVGWLTDTPYQIHATECHHRTRNHMRNNQLSDGTKCFMGDVLNTGESYNNNIYTTTTSLATPETMTSAG